MTNENEKYDAHETDDCPHTTCENCDNKYLQLMPATGWVAWYLEDDGQIFSQSLVAWALERNGLTVTPLVWIEGYVQPAEMANLISVETLEDGRPEKDLIDAARERVQSLHERRAEQLKADNRIS